MSNLSQAAVISAALGLMVGYDSALAQCASAHAQGAPHEQQQSMQRLAEEIHKVIRQAEELERTFMSLAKKCSTNGVIAHIPPEGYSTLAQLVTNLRGVELGLKKSEVPEPLADLHAKLRRAVAKGRSWVVVVQDMTRQFYTAPNIIDGQADGQALKALAEHATQRLVVLANA